AGEQRARRPGEERGKRSEHRPEAPGGGDQRPGARAAELGLGDRRPEDLKGGEEDRVADRRGEDDRPEPGPSRGLRPGLAQIAEEPGRGAGRARARRPRGAQSEEAEGAYREGRGVDRQGVAGRADGEDDSRQRRSGELTG